MAKHFTASSKQLKPDPRFGSVLASKFVNCLMHDGKKSAAQGVFYSAMDIIKNMPAELLKSMHARDQLAAKLSEHVGVFDHSDKTVGDIAKYGIEKLGIKTAIPAGQEAFFLETYLSALPAPSRARTGRTVEATGMDAADKGEKPTEALTKYLGV